MPITLPSLSIIPTSTGGTGVRNKPKDCYSCPLITSSGFIPDRVGSNPRLALLFAQPTREDMIYNEALAEKPGERFLRDYILPFDLTVKDLIISFVHRCYTKVDKDDNVSLNSDTRRKADACCRVYDNRSGTEGKLLDNGQSINDFNPNWFIITYDPKEVWKKQTPAYMVFIRRAIQQALTFSDQGFRPLVVFGIEAANLVAPALFKPDHPEHSLKYWIGHYFAREVDYTFTSSDNQRELKVINPLGSRSVMAAGAASDVAEREKKLLISKFLR